MVKKRVLMILLVLFIIVLIAANYFTFFYSPKCKDFPCFESRLKACKRTSYLNDARDIAWLYTIKGKSGNDCVVKVKALQAKEGVADVERLEGKEMTCNLPLGLIAMPESDPNLCTGRLKEEMQSMIIEKLHQYILEQIGEISAELLKPINSS